MKSTLIVTGTDTGIGKTMFSAGLTAALGASYWKPVQSGLEDETDSEFVARIGRVPPSRIIPERYRLVTPASPHLAARIDGVEISMEDFVRPAIDGPLVIEGAGGLLVPLNETDAYADLMARWQAPVVLCARTALGTINHTLLSLEALKARGVPVLGVAFIGDEVAESQRIIGVMGKARVLGRLPFLPSVTPEALSAAFAENFRLSDFEEALA